MKKASFHRIALMGRTGVSGIPETLIALKDHLLSLDKAVVIEHSAAELLPEHGLMVVHASELHRHADLLIVVGGDGSLLSAAHIAADQTLPILGINRGRLGFLTDIHPDELSKIDAVLEGDYQEETRFLLHATLENNGAEIATGIALNDVVLLPGDAAHMIEFNISINHQRVCHQRADGLIVATPTGSTAYALSGGGPILHPKLNAMVLVSMFPHTLSTRPIVVQGDSEIAIHITAQNQTSPYVSCDGLNRVAIPAGGYIHIRQYSKTLRLIHPEDHNYYATLREKLGWEKQTTGGAE